MFEAMTSSPFFGLALTLICWWLAVRFQKKTGLLIFNPVLVTSVLVIAILLIFHIPLERYNTGADIIKMLLGPATAALADQAVGIEPRLKKVICASADKFVGSPDRKRELHALYGAEICDMESAAVVLTCNRSGVPCLLIKTVSDGIEGGAEEFKAELQRSAALCLAVADKIIRAL